jgi:hypothetical protein
LSSLVALAVWWVMPARGEPVPPAHGHAQKQTAIKIVDGSVEVVSEGQWTKFR